MFKNLLCWMDWHCEWITRTVIFNRNTTQALICSNCKEPK